MHEIKEDERSGSYTNNSSPSMMHQSFEIKDEEKEDQKP